MSRSQGRSTADLKEQIRAAEERLKNAEARSRQAKHDAGEAMRAQIRTHANAAVNALVREGALSGSSVEKFRAVYVAVAQGDPVTREQMKEMVLSLPRFAAMSTQRLSTERLM